MIGEVVAVGVIGLLTALGYRKLAKTQHGEMTPSRQIIFENALTTPNMPPEKLRALATAFEGEGLRNEADQLRKRAENAELPPEVKAKHQEVFRKAMLSVDANVVEKVAAGFQAAGKSASAEQLRTYAKGLRAKGSVEVHNSAPTAAAAHETPQTVSAPSSVSAGAGIHGEETNSTPHSAGEDHSAVNGVATGVTVQVDANASAVNE